MCVCVCVCVLGERECVLIVYECVNKWITTVIGWVGA